MRASRLLQILMILQNRGRQTAASLAQELEVAQRTIYRDVDAMSEAGLPIIVHRGSGGGIELGFDYRSRLTGLSQLEAEALGVMLSVQPRVVGALGLAAEADQAKRKLLESLPDTVRRHAQRAAERFRTDRSGAVERDPVLFALADAVRNQQVIVLNPDAPAPQVVHPVALVQRAEGWSLLDGRTDRQIELAGIRAINISRQSFAP